MMLDNEPPCGVLFETFKNFGRVSYRDLAAVILSDKPIAGGRSPRQRSAEDKSYLSRMVVHSKPGDLIPSMFADFQESAHTLYSMLRSPARANHAAEEILTCFSGEAAQAMAGACKLYGLDHALYLNTANRIFALQGVSTADRAFLLVLLFLETGCLQDTKSAASDVLQLTERTFNVAPVTQTAQTYHRSSDGETEAEDVRLALFRVQGSRLSGRPYVLSTGPKGTEIGYLSTAADSITDVEETVSRHHLLIFRGEDGQWYARGLDSRNGTVLVSGNDRSETVVEPPRDHAQGFVREDVLVKPGDKLVLARDTVFMVMQIDPESV